MKLMKSLILNEAISDPGIYDCINIPFWHGKLSLMQSGLAAAIEAIE